MHALPFPTTKNYTYELFNRKLFNDNKQAR